MSEIIVKMKSDYIKIKGGEYIRDLVRCKDCKHRIYDKSRDLFYCEMYYGMGDVNDKYCSECGARFKA